MKNQNLLHTTFIIARVISAALLVWALEKHPYGYYTLLRWIVCGVTVYGAYLASEFENKTWIWIFVIIAILFNPLIPIHLKRATWTYIDVGVAVILVVSIFVLRKTKPREVERDKEQVNLLISGAKINAIAFTTPSKNPHFNDFANVLSLQNKSENERLDFYMTVAGVGVALISLKLGFPKSDSERIASLIKQALDEWNQYGSSGLNDFVAFVLRQPKIEDKKGQDVTFQYAVGNWVMSNMKSRMPSREEMKYSYVIGNLLVKAFSTWWNDLSCEKSENKKIL